MPVEIYDVLSIGLGPAALSVSIALLEENAAIQSRRTHGTTDTYDRPDQQVFSSLGGLQDALKREENHHGSASKDAFRRAKNLASEGGAGLKERELSFYSIEAHSTFKWHPGMMLDGSRMQISFLKDLVTLRNPSSTYSFLSYLHSRTPSRLLSFISLAVFTPTRREFSDYMSWCALKVERELLEKKWGGCGFGEKVVGVDAVEKSGEVGLLEITSQDLATGEIRKRRTRNLLVSTGGRARIPKLLMELYKDPIREGKKAKVLHSSQYLEKIDSVLDDILSTPINISNLSTSITPPTMPTPSNSIQTRPLRFAIIGSGQSSAEIFLSLRAFLSSKLHSQSLSVRGRPEIHLHLRQSALRPSDSSAFSNEVFDPGMSHSVYRVGQEGRSRLGAEMKGTNYGVVEAGTLGSIYEAMYAQKVDEDIASSPTASPTSASNLLLDPKLIIHPYSELLEVSQPPSAELDQGITITFRNSATEDETTKMYDTIVCGTGYDRQGWKEILFPASSSAATTASLGLELNRSLAPLDGSTLVESPNNENTRSLSEVFSVGVRGRGKSWHDVDDTTGLRVEAIGTASVTHSSHQTLRSYPRPSLSGSSSSSSDLEEATSRSPSISPIGSASGSSSTSSDNTSSRASTSTSPARSILEVESSKSSTSPSGQSELKTTEGTGTTALFDYTVLENYRLDLPEKFHRDNARGGMDEGLFRPTIWLQGSNEKTHGISDSLLSVLAVRSGEITRAIWEEGWLGAH